MHTVTIAAATATNERITWTCTCGANRNAADIGQAGAESLGHLRDVEDGLI